MHDFFQVPKVCHVERVVEVPQVQIQEASYLVMNGLFQVGSVFFFKQLVAQPL